MVTPFNSLSLLYPSCYVRKMWRGLVYDPLDKETIPPPDEKGWVALSTMDSTLKIRIQDIAKLLYAKEIDIQNSLNNPESCGKLAAALHQRFLVPPYEKLQAQILKKYPLITFGDYHVQITKKIEQTRSISLYGLNFGSVEESAKHLTRKNACTSLPLEISENGQQWAILKKESYAPPYRSGEFKNIYHSVNLHSLQLAIWAKAPINARRSRTKDEIKDSLNNEISIQSSFNIPEIVKIYHHVFYKNRHGSERVGIMMECCDGTLESLIECRWAEPSKDLSKAFWNILEDTLSALAELEENKIHHRDVKGENIFYVETDEGIHAKLGDFGFAIHVDQEKAHPKPLSSPLYAAPEFLKGHEIIIEGNKLVEKGLESKRLGEHYKTCAQSCLDIINHIKPDDPQKESRESLAKRNLKVHLSNSSLYETSSVEQMNRGKQLIREGSEFAANTKGDLWALGLVLYTMRTGKSPITLFTNKPEPQVTHSYFCTRLSKIQQRELAAHFPSKSKDSLEAVNLALLTIDPAQRRTAKSIHQQVRNLRLKGAAFI